MGLLDGLSRLLATLGFKTDIQMLLVVFGLIFARVTLAIGMAPFIGGGSVAGRIKVGLSAIVAFLLLPVLVPTTPREISPTILLGLLIKEALIGAAIGMLTQFIFYAVQMAGVLVDTQRGMNQMTFFAPQLPGNTSALGQFQFQAALILFLAMDGHLLFLKALSLSFVPLPLLTFPQFHGGVLAVLDLMARVTADTLVVAMQLAAPVLVALFLIDVAFGCIGKAGGRINVHAESQPVKAMVGLAIFLLSAGLIFDQLKIYFVQMLLQIDKLARGVS